MALGEPGCFPWPSGGPELGSVCNRRAEAPRWPQSCKKREVCCLGAWSIAPPLKEANSAHGRLQIPWAPKYPAAFSRRPASNRYRVCRNGFAKGLTDGQQVQLLSAQPERRRRCGGLGVRHSDVPVVLFHRIQLNKPGGRRPPVPLGFIALCLLPARAEKKQVDQLGPPAPVLPVTSLQISAQVASLRCPILRWSAGKVSAPSPHAIRPGN